VVHVHVNPVKPAPIPDPEVVLAIEMEVHRVGAIEPILGADASEGVRAPVVRGRVDEHTALGPNPQMPLPVNLQAQRVPQICAVDGGGGVKRLPIETTCAFAGPHLARVIDRDTPDLIAGQPVGGCEAGKAGVVVAEKSPIGGGKPERAGGGLHDPGYCPDGIALDPVVRGVGLAVVPEERRPGGNPQDAVLRPVD